MPEDINNKDFENAFSDTVDGFADLFNEVEMSDVSSIAGLALSTQPAGKYTVIGKVDEGGMKQILEIEDTDTTRTLAMALIKEKAKKENKEKAAERFVYEARITALLQHPNIVPVHDIGINNDGEPYFTMKLIQGDNLKKILHKLQTGDQKYIQKYPLTELLTVFLKTCEAIAYAHSKDVIHLDMKPDNIQVSDYGEVLIVDWGLAKVLHAPFEENNDFTEVIDSVDLTLDGFIKGTPGFMAPEQAMGLNQEKNTLTDIYSLGAILYNILTLTKPLEDDTIEELCSKTIQGDIPPPRERNPDRYIPSALEAVCLKAMRVDPAKRYQKVDMLISEINAYISGFSTKAEEASPFTELKLLISRHKAIASLVALGLIISLVFVAKLQKNQTVILNTVSKLKEERKERINISQLAAPKILTEALQFIDVMDFDTARDTARLCTELDETFDEAWLELGKLSFANEEFDQALKAFRKCQLKSAGQYLSVLKQYGTNFHNLADEQVLQLIEELNLIDPEDYITIQIFQKLNSSEKSITQKVSLVSKALEVLNSGESDFNFTCHFTPEGEIKLSMRGSWKIQNIKPLIGLPIKEIKLNDTSVQDIRILQSMPLTQVDLSYAPVKSIDSLKNKPIKDLLIRGSRITSMESISFMENLSSIEVDENTSAILETLLALENSNDIFINKVAIEKLRHKYRSKLLQLR
ncbi:MAG: protein kinase [Lentisphaerales bacterium]|nr:protein kinase [Lentisphaerales bacterium]